MSVAEIAAQLRQEGNETATQISGIVGTISSDLDSIGGKLQQCQALAEDSTDLAAQLLGEGHHGTDAIVGAAAQVVEKIQEIQGLLSQFSLESGGVTERAGVLSQTFESVAAGLMSS